ncbi:MAG: Holliday junction resolvase RuvX [Dehalococcoidia bacterium]
MRILGLDVGERRIGVAVADERARVALPVAVVERRELPADLDAIARLAREQGAEAVVIGLPISLTGSLGPQAEAVKAFGQELSARLSLPIEYWDERLSTVEAQRRLTSAGQRGPKAKARRDALAAAIILQSYLDTQAQAKPSSSFEL